MRGRLRVRLVSAAPIAFLALFLAVLLGSACFSGPQIIRAEALENPCRKPEADGGRRSVGDLARVGDLFLSGALGDPDSLATDARLANSLVCYSKALRLSPDSYRANLSTGIAHLILAKRAQQDSARRRSHLRAVKQHLGHAYMQRQGPYEVLFYLAEAAYLDKQVDKAKQMLNLLVANKAKVGPAQAMLGYIAEVQEDEEAAKAHYQAALDAGWPFASVTYAENRLDSVGESRSSWDSRRRDR